MCEPTLLAPGMYPGMYPGMISPMGMYPSIGIAGPMMMPSCYNQVSMGMGPLPFDSCSFSTPATSKARKVWDFAKTWGPMFLLGFALVKFTNGWNNVTGLFTKSNSSQSLGRLSPK